MDQNVLFNGTVYQIPDVGDDNYGQNLTDYFVAIASGSLQKTGGAFTLTAEANFGATYGLVSAYYKSRTANIAAAGAIRLARADVIGWRNTANTGDLPLGVDSSDRLTFDGHPIIPSTALTASRAVATDASGVLTASATTAVQLAYLSAATGTTGTASSNLVFSALATLTDPTLSGTIKIGSTLGILHSANDGTITSSTIVNGDVSATAAIAFSKLAALASGNILVGSVGTVPTSVALSGDATLIASGAMTLATVNANTGSWGSSTAIPAFTVNAKGLITAASTNAVIAPAGTLTGTTLASNVVSSSLTSVGTIATGAWSGTAITASKGGTGIDTSASSGLASIAAGTWSVGALTGDVTTSARVATLVATTNATLTTLSALTSASTLATIGTITTGVWHGTVIGALYGGFGADVSASNGVPLFASGTPTFTSTIGTGNFVRAIAPTFTGATNAAALVLSSTLTVGGNTTSDANYGTIDAVTLSQQYQGHFTATFAGASTGFSATQTATVNYQRIGKMVTLSIPAVLATTGSGSVATLVSDAIPTNLTPSGTVAWPIFIRDNAATPTTPGQFSIVSGSLTFRKDAGGGTFTASQQGGWPLAFSVTYLTA